MLPEASFPQRGEKIETPSARHLLVEDQEVGTAQAVRIRERGFATRPEEKLVPEA